MMTRDTGTLLAQVIPVMALALGLELRAAAAKVTANRREGVPDPDAAVTYLNVFVALVLAAGEQVAIAAAGGVKDFTWRHLWTNPLVPGSYLLGNALTLSIIAVFLLPAHQAVVATLSPELTVVQRNLRSIVWAGVLVAGGYLLPLAL